MKPKLGDQEGSAAQLVANKAGALLQTPLNFKKAKSSGVWVRMQENSLVFLFKFYKVQQQLPELYTYVMLMLIVAQSSFPNSVFGRTMIVHPTNNMWIFDTAAVMTAFLGCLIAWMIQLQQRHDRKTAIAESQDANHGKSKSTSWLMNILGYLVQFVVMNIASRSVTTFILSLVIPSREQYDKSWVISGLPDPYIDSGLRAFQLFMITLTAVMALVLIGMYVIFIENPIPRMSILSASNSINFLFLIITPGVTLLFGAVGKALLDTTQFVYFSDGANVSLLILLIARGIPSVLGVISSLVSTVFYNKEAPLLFSAIHLLVYFLSVFDFMSEGITVSQAILKVYSLLCSIIFLLLVALIRNLIELKRLPSFKSDDFDLVNKVVQECFPGNPAYGTQNQEMNVTMYLNYVAPGIGPIIKSFVAEELSNQRTFRSPSEILLMALFDELLKSKVENGFTACVVYIYYLTNINFSLSRVLMLHSLLRMSVTGVTHRFLLMIVEEMIRLRIDHCMRRGDMIIHERLAISQCAKDSSGLKKINRNQGLRDDGLGQGSGSIWMFQQQNQGESNSSLRFQRRTKDNLSGVFHTEKTTLAMKGLHMYQTYELLLDAIQNQLGKILEFYETLSAPDMNIFQLHQNSADMCTNSRPPKALFSLLEQECLGECSFHLIPFGLYIHLAENNSQVMRENLRKYATRSKSLLKRITSKLWHWQCKASEVILETSLEPTKRGEIMYVSRTPRWFCRNMHGKEFILKQNISALFPDEFAKYHSLLVNQYLERFDREYFGKEIDRYIRGFGADNYMRVVVSTTMSTSLTQGVTAITLLIPSRQEDYFLVLENNRTLSGVSESLARLDPGISENIGKRTLAEISPELPAFIENLLGTQASKEQNGQPSRIGGRGEDLTEAPTARPNPQSRDKLQDLPSLHVHEIPKDSNLLAKESPIEPRDQPKTLQLKLSEVVVVRVIASLLRPVVHSFCPIAREPKHMVTLIIPKSLIPERLRMGPNRIPTERYQGMVDIDDEELDDGLFDMDSLEVYDLEEDQKHRFGHQQSSSIVDHNPPPITPRPRDKRQDWPQNANSIIDVKSPRNLNSEDPSPRFHAGTPPLYDPQMDAMKVGTALLDPVTAPNSLMIPPNKGNTIEGLSRQPTDQKSASRKIEFVTENIKLYAKKPTKRGPVEPAKGVVTESLGPSLASSMLRKIGQSGLTVDKISTSKNTRLFVVPVLAGVLIMQACLWTFYSLIFVHLSGITEQYNTARQFLFINFHPVLACYSTSILQTQWILRDFGLETIDRYHLIQSVIDDYDPEDPYFESFPELYTSYNTHKNFTAPVDNRFIPALTKYKYTESIPLSPNSSARADTNLHNYKWQLAMIQNFRLIENQLRVGIFNGTFYYETHHLLDRASLEVSEKTNTEIIVQQGVGYAATRQEIFWYCMLCAFGLIGAIAIVMTSIFQFRAKIIWVYKTYRAIDAISLAKKMDQIEQLKDSIQRGGKDSVCLSNTYFMNLMLKSATNDLASTFKKSAAFRTGHNLQSKVMNPLSSVVPKTSSNVVHRTFKSAKVVNTEGSDRTVRGERSKQADNSPAARSKVHPRKVFSKTRASEALNRRPKERSEKGLGRFTGDIEGRLGVRRVRSLSSRDWFGVGIAYMLLMTTIGCTICIFLVKQFTSDQAKDRISDIYEDSRYIIGVKLYTLKALQGVYDTILAHRGVISPQFKSIALKGLESASAQLTQNTVKMGKILSGNFDKTDLRVFGGLEFLANTCTGVIETNYYKVKDCQVLLDTAMTRGYDFQYRWISQTVADLLFTLKNLDLSFDSNKFFLSPKFLQFEFFCNFILMQQFLVIYKRFFGEIGQLYDYYAEPNYATNTTLLSVASFALLVFSLLLILRMNNTMKACLYSLLPLPGDQLVNNNSIKMIVSRVGAFIH